MAYSNIMLKGKIGFNAMGWPLIIMERARSDNPNTPVLCEVFGFEHECGSVYYKDITLVGSKKDWEEKVRAMGFLPEKRYFKGQLSV